MLHGHGDDAYLFKEKIIADFSTNVYYKGEPKGLKQHLFENWNEIKRYPEIVGESFSKKIAVHFGLGVDQILVANGAAESIYTIAQSFKSSSSTIIIPTFSEYEDACRMNEHKISFLEWEDISVSSKMSTDLCFICNPNNPTGFAFTGLSELVRLNPDTLFVVDEAFIEFTQDIASLIPLTRDFDNLIVLRSMTKAYAIPGLRLGYVVSNAEIIEKLRSYKLPWTVNALAIRAGNYIMDNYSACKLPVEGLIQEKNIFFAQLKTLDFIEILESSTHFFLLKTLIGSSSKLKQFLLARFNLLIRDASNFRGLSKGHFRISTLAQLHNQMLIDALIEWKNQS